MAVTSTEISTEYQGNGVTTSFAIGFQFQDNGQVKVKVTDTSVDPATEAFLVEGTDYTLTGGDPATGVSMTTAPVSTDILEIYRDTERVSTYDYIETGSFKAEDHEAALDRIIMMIQEVGESVATTLGSGQFTRLLAQDVDDAGTISTNPAQRLLKDISGNGGPVVCDTTTAIASGYTDGQELRLVGGSDDNTVTILETSLNVKLNGDMTFRKNSVLDLFYDLTEAVWKEATRRE